MPLDFDSIYLFQAKFMLFNQQVHKVQSIWPKVVNAKMVTEVLLFLKELTPN